jgi:geranylgeranyl diphosphate synthase, type II
MDSGPTSTPTASFVLAALRARGEQAERFVDGFLLDQPSIPASLLEAIRYSFFAGGKRLRPTLVLEWCEACQGDASSKTALAAAGAIELIHTFSLVHDDLPAMDDDDLRRGRPTNHKVFGEAMAILAGDAMTTLAFQLIADRAATDRGARLVCELARAGGPAGMIGGQVIDIENENVAIDLAALKQLHAMKTGALLTCACRMGAIAGDADETRLAAATAFGTHLGLAFQIMDDVLDVTATSAQMGKATNKDHHAGKNTYPKLLGLAQSQALAQAELNAALDALKPLGAAGHTLAELAQFVLKRTS